MQKRPFVLLEVLIAIAILSMTLAPLIGSPFLLLKKQRQTLIELTEYRHAPIVFYRLLKGWKQLHPKWDFPKLGDVTPKALPFTYSFDVTGLDTFNEPFHYHLYYHERGIKIKDLNLCMLYCAICFKKKCRFEKAKSEGNLEAFQLIIARKPPTSRQL